MVLTAPAGAARATRAELSRYAPKNDILWDDEPDQNETPHASAPAPLGSGADRLEQAGRGVAAA